MSLPAWMTQEAPAGYIPGLGRGATGFTTRSDIGPARMTPDPSVMAKLVEEAARKKAEEGPAADYSDSNFDQFMGFGESLADSTAPYEQDDREADEVWDSIDRKMDERRRKRREERIKEELAKFRKERPKIQQQFADIKRDLNEVSMDEWDAIPEVGDQTHRFKKKAKTNGIFTPVPDSLLEKARQEHEQFTTLDDKQQKFGGFDTPLSSGFATPGLVTPMKDLTQIGEARKTLLDHGLKKMSDSVQGQTVIDPKGYLTDLASTVKISSAEEIGDIKKARLLLKSVTQTNPKHAPGWIAAARLEEVAGKLASARKIITQACTICPDSEDVWLEAIRLQTPENQKAILAKAIKEVPKSVKLWMQASALEEDVKAKKKILRKALEVNPTSVRLWKAAIELENEDDAKILLQRAVECVPHSVEMWLALAHLETYENARKVLNKARENIPTDHQIWITAAQLEEAHGNEEGVRNIIKRAIKSLASHQVVLDRESWFKEAEKCEQSGSVITAQSLIRECVGMSVEDEDRKRTWIQDAESLLAKNCVECARAVYAHALSVFPGKKGLWLRLAQLEKAHGTKDTLDAALKKAVAYCPQAEILWLMAAKERWIQGDVDGARGILGNAFNANPDSEQIWLAAVKLESENKEYDRARALLKKARERAGTERVWMKSALLEREVGNTTAEREILEQALKLYPQFAKLWLMRAQLEEKLARTETKPAVPPPSTPSSGGFAVPAPVNPHLEAAKEFYQRGVKNCPQSIPLWLGAAALEESFSSARARSLLEKARLVSPKNPELWRAAVRVEVRANNAKMAQSLLAKALQECPNSGILWAEAIQLENRAGKKSRSVDALKHADNDPHVILALARLFWGDHKVDKARTWLNRAVTLDHDLGDAWANLYKFELTHGGEQEQKEVVRKCVEADPHHGEAWCKVSKALENAHMPTETILKKVALGVEVPT